MLSGTSTEVALIVKQQLKFWQTVKEMPLIKDLIVRALTCKSKYVEYYVNIENVYRNPEHAFKNSDEIFRNTTHESILNANDKQTKIKNYFNIFDNFSTDISISHTYSNNEQSRILLTRYAVGSHTLEEETGRWRGVSSSIRKCKLCEGDVEDLKHFLIDCRKLDEVRRRYPNYPTSVKEFFKWPLCSIAIRHLHRTRSKYGR